MGKENSLTPLMLAAQTNSEELVELLLNENADPNQVDKDNQSSLTHSILAENASIIARLFEKTTVSLQNSLERLAEAFIDWNENARSFERIKSVIKEHINKDSHLFKIFLVRTAIFGNTTWLEFLLQECPSLIKTLDKVERIKKWSDQTISSYMLKFK